VRAYVAAPLCEGARRELDRARGRAGEVKVRAVCLPPTRVGGRLDLAALGANARRATEDSAAVAYLGEPDPVATRFSLPILDEAGITLLQSSSGSGAMSQLLTAIGNSDTSSSLREALHESQR